MEKIIFGYYIGSDVHFDLNKKTLVNTGLRSRQKAQIMLRNTMFRLFVFLIENADGSIINNTDILVNVWDKHGLSSSNQRLWQVMQSLKFKLGQIGVPDDFIMKVESKGYYIKEHMITLLFSEKINHTTSGVNHDLRHF